jgi:hypothetical protein
MVGLSTDVPTSRKPDPHPRQPWHLRAAERQSRLGSACRLRRCLPGLYNPVVPGESRAQALLTTARQDEDRLRMPQLACLFTHKRREVPVRAP